MEQFKDKRINCYIGIDPGKRTGLAVWDGKNLTDLRTLPLHRALEYVDTMHDVFGDGLTVVMEDARLRKWYGTNSAARIQGAGSIKRDCAVWEEFCRDKGISLNPVPPEKGATKWPSMRFAVVTGWYKRCSNHARDAAVLVYGLPAEDPGDTVPDTVANVSARVGDAVEAGHA